VLDEPAALGEDPDLLPTEAAGGLGVEDDARARRRRQV
jgi:hypothetical protein